MKRLKEHLIKNGATSTEILSADGVRSLTKDIIYSARKCDPVDAVKDIALALAILEIELDIKLTKERV